MLKRIGIGVLLAVTGLLIATPSVAAHEPPIPKLPANTGCDEFVVLVKASVTEDRAAANMLAESLRIRSGDRCLLDAYDSGAVTKQIDSTEVSGERQLVFVVGGSAAISDGAILSLGIDRVIRVSGADRWATQGAVARIIWNLGEDKEYLPQVTRIQAAASPQTQIEDATEEEHWDWGGWGTELDGFAGSSRFKASETGNSRLFVACGADETLDVGIAAAKDIIPFAQDGSGGLYLSVA